MSKEKEKQTDGITKEIVNEHLGIDFSDDASDRRVESLIKVADAFLKGAIGENYNANDPRAIQLSLMIITDLYDNISMSAKKEAVYRKMAHDMELQMRLELRE